MRSLFIIILVVQLLVPLTSGQSFFDNYVKKFLEKIFSNGRNSTNGNNNNGYGNNNNGYGNDNNGYSDNNNGYGNDNNGYGDNNNGYGNDNNGYGDNNNGYGNDNNGYGGNARSPSRNSFRDLRQPSCDCSLKNDNRIVNGREGQFVPWLVSLGYIYKNTRGDISYAHFCGGSILNSEIILTAGHCLKDLNKTSVNNYLIRFGLTDLNEQITRENTIQWADFTVNEKYMRDSNDNGNDIGIIKLKKPIDLRNGRTKAACLDLTNNYSSFLQLSGWGRTTPFGRHNQTGATLPTKLLELDMSEDRSKSTSYIISAVGKAKDSGTCSGDSGSPLQSINPRKVSVVGLVSYGISNKEGVFCLSNTGFVRLSAHSRFIQNIIGDSFCRA